MSSSISTKSALTISAAAVVGGIVAYAAYFDYKRRNDPSFRKQLRKEKKRAARSNPEQPGASKAVSTEEIKRALESLRDEPLPDSVPDKEQYFMDNVQLGETLCTQGPLYHLVAALAFYRALRVYPSPVELIMIYQKTVPEPVFNIIMQMTTLDVSNASAGSAESAPSAPSEAQASETVPAPAVEVSLEPKDVDTIGGEGKDKDDAESEPEAEAPAVTSGPPSEFEVSSQEWDTVTDPGSAAPSQIHVFGPPPP